MEFAETNGRSVQDCFDLIYPGILDKHELAEYCFANVRTVDNWTKQDQVHIKKTHHIEKIEKLGAVIALLEAELSFSNEETREFLTTPHVDTSSATSDLHTMIDLLGAKRDGAAIVISHAVERCIG